MRVVLGSILAASIAVSPAGARPADHLRPSPSVSHSGAQSVPGGIDFSPVPDPFRGAWRGTVTWQVGCAEAKAWGWEVFWVDLSSGAYNNPTAEHRFASFGGLISSAYSDTSGASTLEQVPAGSAVFPHIRARCYAPLGHDSEYVELDGAPLFVAPYVWYPRISGVSRNLQARRPPVLQRGKRVSVQLRIDERSAKDERVEVSLVGAGVRVHKTFAPGQLDRPPSVRIRPTKAGVIHYWAVLKPYGARSRTVGIRVR